VEESAITAFPNYFVAALENFAFFEIIIQSVDWRNNHNASVPAIRLQMLSKYFALFLFLIMNSYYMDFWFFNALNLRKPVFNFERNFKSMSILILS